jgi:hypothetical protein
MTELEVLQKGMPKKLKDTHNSMSFLEATKFAEELLNESLKCEYFGNSDMVSGYGDGLMAASNSLAIREYYFRLLANSKKESTK